MTIRVQEAEFIRNPADVMQHVERGDEVRVERDGYEIAVLHDPRTHVTAEARQIDDVLSIVRSRDKVEGPFTMTSDYAEDMQDVRRRWNEPLEWAKWD